MREGGSGVGGGGGGIEQKIKNGSELLDSHVVIVGAGVIGEDGRRHKEDRW